MFSSKKAQKWFDKKYTKGKKEVTKMRFSNNSIYGPLKIDGFTKLKNISPKVPNLTSLEISNCPQLTNVKVHELKELENLSVSNCPELIKLDCSHCNLTELEILEVGKLDELNCSYNSITNLSLNLYPDITKINCSHNEKLTNLYISNCSKLEELDCSYSQLIGLDLNNCSKLKRLDCSHSRLTGLDLSNCPNPESIKVNPPNLDITRRKRGNEKIKNLLIVGRTGGGKSTLSNVLTGTDEFEESARSVSVTRNFKKKDFDWKNTKYYVVDTIGVGDTSLAEKKVLYKIIDGIYEMPEGISQVLFVIDGRPTAEEIEAFYVN